MILNYKDFKEKILRSGLGHGWVRAGHEWVIHVSGWVMG